MFKAPRGTSDILPQEKAYWKYIEEKAVYLCQLYGYQPLNTPVFEDYQLFAHIAPDGADIIKEMYVFEDRSGQKLALAAEGTAPICRAYLEHGLFNLPQPVKLYYIIPAFRYERPQAGRYRQHHQLGCEAIGDADPVLDAEVIELMYRFLSSLGLSELLIEINSIGCRQCQPGYVETLKKYYSTYRDRLCPDCKIRLARNPLRLLDCKEVSCQEIITGAPKIIDYLCSECQTHFQSVQKYLTELGISYQLNHKLVRGLDYYTRTVFEVKPEGKGVQIALGGGGRYDNLIEELGGKPTPAVGFAAGIERIIIVLKNQNVIVPTLPKPVAYVACLGTQAKLEATKLVSRLRHQGIAAIQATGDKSLKSQLRQANSLDVKYTVIIGEKEVANETAVLRDMSSGEQKTVPFNEIASLLEKR
ncbi:MAG: histidine--tRNA ligase [Dehalococcoidales bacterium]|nr:histidine--tRNA ligase [Dehalococcoidales bacterium]